MLDVEFADEAIRDVATMRLYGEENFGSVVADRYVDDLQAAITQLRDYPRLAPAWPDASKRYRCKTFRGRRIFYRFDQAVLTVVRVLHHSQNVDAGSFE